MATVRELVAKFGFDIDTGPLEDFNKEFDKTKKSLKTFAAGALLLRGFSKIGKEFDIIRRNMSLFGDEFEAMRIVNGVDRTVSSVNDLSKAVRNSMEELGDLGFTKKVAQDAEDFAAITGESIEDIMGMIDQAASGQDLGFLKRLGLTNQKELEQLQRMNVEMRTATVKTIILNRLTATRADRQKKLARATKDLDVQQRRFGKIFEDFGKIIGETINPILAAMLEIFNDMAEFFVENALGRFLTKMFGLGVLFSTIWSGISLLIKAFRILAVVTAPISGFFLAIGAAIAGAAIFIHDLWAAFNDPAAALLFDPKKSTHFKRWVMEIEAIGKAFDMLGDKISGIFDGAPEFLRGLFLSDAQLKLSQDVMSGGVVGGDAGKTGDKVANITINADTIEAAIAGSKETKGYLEKMGFDVNEQALAQLSARFATTPGG